MSPATAVARRIYEVFDSDLEALLALVAPDIAWVSPEDAIEPGARFGHDGVRAAFAATAAAWESTSHTPEEFEEVAGHALVTVTFRGHGRGSGMDLEQTEFHLWTLSGDVPARFEWFYHRDEAITAALGGS